MYWQQFGPADGIPAVVLHGGPGSALSPRLCALACQAGPYRVITFDQRGCGNSAPRGATRSNTLDHLVADIDALRIALGIPRWLVMGGSWGATLAAAYAARHTGAVSGVLLRGLFVPSHAELSWFFQEAAGQYPTAWHALADLAPADARHALLPWLIAVFREGDSALQQAVAQAWLAWERALGGSPPAPPAQGEALTTAVDRYRVQTHYLSHQCWLGDTGVAQSCAQLGTIPLLFIHGENDQVCRPAAARAAWQTNPAGRWHTVPGAGHDPFHPAMIGAMAQALRQFARQSDFAPYGTPA
ncbi:MAG TPA: alpha/beta fold hydrolase [Burkholderiaceae bacterium]